MIMMIRRWDLGYKGVKEESKQLECESSARHGGKGKPESGGEETTSGMY